ncbi:hypothetical protein PLEOSDRAFT_1109731 [Pleurotus ostreatus PC15]|uniref:SMP-30/Gluconolactonase/LRE-like region domain-containing protein n=1 Tax=Pleurotus ostreatus (strain PC15) TaxID=1137138 RepID=A0A067N443_PLEO1|nr:hypothetical protein PLEOSDRAFT_1109731 [Pleurotus ostreatus PC15]
MWCRAALATTDSDPVSFAVLGQNATFRASAFDTSFNPTSTPPPFFQVVDNRFLDILGHNPSFHEIASNPNLPFANEAPVYVPALDELFFSSFSSPGNASVNNKVNRVRMSEVEEALKASKGSTVNVTVTPLDLPETVLSTNGGSGPFRGSLLFVGNGLGPLPPAVTLVNPRHPHNVTVLLNNFFGRQFNSIDDVKIHPKNGKIFFTDVQYGFSLGIRPAPLMPNQVYRFDPDTGEVRIVADGFVRPNGIAFTNDGKTAYISDTGSLQSPMRTSDFQTQPATIYAFDVDSVSQRFVNRRVLAFTDAGIPDGLQVDMSGNVYAGTGDGVQVWNADGTLLGKFFVGTRTANMAFAGFGRLVILSQTKLFLARINAGNVNLEG